MNTFKLTSQFVPNGDQPDAIERLTSCIQSNSKYQVLLGVTGSGKTFTMAHVIANTNRPTLVIAPNKTLAAQLYSEFKSLFPKNAVEYFVSYYDYYQPEAYIPSSDTYIQKDSAINEMIDKLRHSATRSVLSRRDVIVVASVSCIYGLGAPEDYLAMRLEIETGKDFGREFMLKYLVNIQYERNDTDFSRGVFRVRGDRVDIFPAYEEDVAFRIEFFGDTVDKIAQIDPLKGSVVEIMDKVVIYPASHYVTTKDTLTRAFSSIKTELQFRIEEFRTGNKLIEAQRIEERTNFDLEMIHEMGYCNGIENYSRHITGRHCGQPPPTLLDYFPKDFLVFIDESHITVPQLHGMYNGDRSRKETLVKYGFRLPSALDNRPLRFEEFENRINQIVFVSATPADFELKRADKNAIIEQIVRPTGLVDPDIEVHPATNQVDDLLEEIRKRVEIKDRVFVTTLTKRMAEDLTEYYTEVGLKVKYLHSDIKTIERMEILLDLRKGEFDVLIGINLLREGLDIPEVSLVAILDADREGFLRSTRSLIQTFGRAARNVRGKVIMYADNMTQSMKQAIDETNRRRNLQSAYNKKHNITPETIAKIIPSVYLPTNQWLQEPCSDNGTKPTGHLKEEDLLKTVNKLTEQMHEAAKNLAFEQAAQLRDKIKFLKSKLIVYSEF